MKQKMSLAVLGLAAAGFSPFAHAVNDAPADADTITLRTRCIEGGAEIPSCFETMAAVANWLMTKRLTTEGLTKPTLVNIGPGRFVGGWQCMSNDVSLKGSGRDRTVIFSETNGAPALSIGDGCTQLNVQDLSIDGTASIIAVNVTSPRAITAWTNVEIIGSAYAWDEFSASCADPKGKHSWFSSRIRALGRFGLARAYISDCAQSWFWGSEIVSEPQEDGNAFALQARNAEVHLYGSDVRLILKQGINSTGFDASGNYLIAALQGSEIHIHGTGLDVIHNGTGTADMLYADADPHSHFHATVSGFNIHVGDDAGKVQRLAGPPGSKIEAPYTWGERKAAPLSTRPHDGTSIPNGVGRLISRDGADRYTETDCTLNGDCSGGTVNHTFPHDMVYRKA